MTETSTAKSKAKAQSDEALEQGTPIEFKGETFHIPSAMDMPFEVLEIAEAGGRVAIIGAVLGDEQMRKFRDTKPSIREALDFLENLAEAAGFDDLGN